MMSRSFLSARLEDVVLVTYRVPASLLLPHLPVGCDLDTPADDPELYMASVVGLRFSDTRVLGVPAVMAGKFPQLNLRFYVRHGARQGVVFVRELVPNRLVAIGARTFFTQPYDVASLTHDVRRDATRIDVRTRVVYQERDGSISVGARGEPVVPESGSHAEFLTKRHWGFFRGRSGATHCYRLEHRPWRVYTIESAEATIDPGVVCGGAWNAVDWQESLHSVLLADGSAVKLYVPEVLERE